MRKIGELIDFSEVRKGDRLTFRTRDNGFGGAGGFIDRTGTVRTVTAKSVVVEGVPALRFPTWPAESSGTALLRRADWYDRQPRLAGETDNAAAH